MYRNAFLVSLVLGMVLAPQLLWGAESPTSLQGSWRFKLDPKNTGLSEQWFTQSLPDTIALPGTTDEARFGQKTEDSDNGQLTRAYKYYGPAWYQRDFEVPPSWAGRNLSLFLERVMWESRVWIDGESKGSADSLGTPHRFQLGSLAPGKHTITLRIDNSAIHPLGDRGHTYSDSMQTIWNGILGRIELQPQLPVHLVRQRIFPKNDGTVLVEMTLANTSSKTASCSFDLSIRDKRDSRIVAKQSETLDVPPGESQKKVSLKLDAPPRLWSEFDAPLYSLETQGQNDAQTDSKPITFGFREVSREGNRLLINGRPSFMRGNMDNVHFPLTGHPPCDVESWRRIFRIYKEYGLNQVRFHSWCPPEAAFQAADEEGLYLQPEILWIDGWMPNGIPGLGKNYKTLDHYVRAEMRRILDTYGNHPSFVFFAIGNELGNSNFNETGRWIQQEKSYDPRHLFAASTARAITPSDDFSDTHNIPGGGQSVNRFAVGHTDWDYESAYSKAKVPIIAHELGQVPVYPEWNEIAKYTGVLRPRNLERLHAMAVKNGLADQDKIFRQASGAMNRILYKEGIEAVLRTPHSSGYSLLGMQDYSGQGEALVGWLDSFYDSKGFVTPEQYRRYSATTVPLARFKKYVWTANETFSAKVLVSHFGESPMKDVTAVWSLKSPSADKPIASGEFVVASLEVGQLAEIGTLEASLASVKNSAHLNLEVRLKGTPFVNDWNIWTFSEAESEKPSPQVTIASELTPAVLETLEKGGRVFLLAHRLGSKRTAVPAGWKPVFWSTAWFNGAPDKTLGAVVQSKHPALAQFPTADHLDWQWLPICSGGKAFLLDELPVSYRPIVQPVSDFHVNQRLGTVFEAAVGKGKLLVCSYDLSEERLKNPAVRQFWNTLLDYAAGERFNPQDELQPAQLQRMFASTSVTSGPRPAEFKNAPIYIECAAKYDRDGDAPWQKELDRAEYGEGIGHEVKATLWRDEDGRYWVGKKPSFTLKTPVNEISRLLVRFRDPNQNGRSGKGTFEGRSFSIPQHQDNPDGTFWLELRVEREDGLDGKLEFQAETLSGPNLMIDRVILMPK